MMRLPIELRTPPWRDRAGRISIVKAVTLAALFVPAILMAKDYASGQWVIPVVGLVYWSGVWATILLLVTLFISPARRIFRWKRANIVRRMVGVGAFAYTVAHLICYFWLRFFDPASIIIETATRISLIVATISFVGLIALCLTSFDATIRWFGAQDWDRLHGTTYVVTGLAVFHFVLSPGAYGGLPFLMLGVYFWLMAWRFFERRRQGESVAVLAGLTGAATALTVFSEALWPAMMFGMDPLQSLAWNFSLEIGLSPGWMMLGLARYDRHNCGRYQAAHSVRRA